MTTREDFDGRDESAVITHREAVELLGHRVVADWEHAEVLYAVQYEHPEGGDPISRSVQRIGHVYWHVFEGDGREHVPHASLAAYGYCDEVLGIREGDLEVTCNFEPPDQLAARLVWAGDGSWRAEEPYRFLINGEPWRYHQDDAGPHFLRDEDPEVVRRARGVQLQSRFRAARIASREAEARLHAARQATERAPGTVFDLKPFHRALPAGSRALKDDEACRRVGAHVLERARAEDSLVFRVTKANGEVACAVHRIGPFHWHWRDDGAAPDAFESLEALLDERSDEVLMIPVDTTSVDAPSLPSTVVARLLVWDVAPADMAPFTINGEAWWWRMDRYRFERAPDGPHTHDIARQRAEAAHEAAYRAFRAASDAEDRVRAERMAFESEAV